MTKTYIPRDELVAAMVARDGLVCMHPDCGRSISLATPEGPLQVTVDHWMPQSWARANGWPDALIWDLENLALMHKKCNADKGDRVPLSDGTLPEKPQSKFRYRRAKRSERPEICVSCNAGRDLGPDEVCASCGSGPMPLRYPRWAKMRSSDCDHEAFWCWACSTGIIDRVPATEMMLLGGEGGDDDDLPEEVELTREEALETFRVKELVSV